MFFALSGAIISAVTLIMQKVSLSRQKTDYRDYNTVVFFFLFVFSALASFRYGWIKIESFNYYYLAIGVAMIVVGSLWNTLFSIGLQNEKVVESELIMMSQPILTILISGLVFTSERNPTLIIPAAVAGIALMISHLRKHHFDFNTNARYLIWAVLLMSVEYLFIKILLGVFSPVALYMLRTFFITFTFLFVLRPSYKTIKAKNLGMIVITALLAVIQMVFIYTAIEQKGIVYTTLFLILSPVLVYVISVFWLRERLQKRTLYGVLVILGCIIFATLVGR